jgi:hypothetical protein
MVARYVSDFVSENGPYRVFGEATEKWTTEHDRRPEKWDVDGPCVYGPRLDHFQPYPA